MRWFLTLPASVLLGVALQAPGSSALENDFSAYPEGSQQCLTDAANDTTCSGNTGSEINKCLCSNKGNFIYNTAECVARKSPADLNAVYDTMENNCAGTGVTIAVSKQAFLSQAAAATQTASSATPTSTSPSSSSSGSSAASPTTSTSPSESSSSSSSSLSQGAKIGLGVGIGFGGVALGLLGWFVFMYSRRRKSPGAASSSSGPNSPYQHDVELSPSGGGNGSSMYHPSPLTPAPEYAQHNAQFGGVAELSPATAYSGWKELPGDYYAGDKKDGSASTADSSKGGHVHKRSSGVPLLAELDDGRGGSMAPVELPGSEVFTDAASSVHAHTPTTAMHEHDAQRPESSGYRDQGLGGGHGG
ncbi:hypothetical protein F4811DRAFT_374563 [Daldinia bambusicola]|nr:hypothetical protein F4811DRAFT_374563 [Daldinia bambusicola]